MSLPDLIEIVPSNAPFPADLAITVPGSKSITNRALMLAALAEGRTTLHGALWSEDTQVMVQCLQTLGYEVQVEAVAGEPGNRTLTVAGQGLDIPAGGSVACPLELYVGNAGTAARFLAAFVCLGHGVYRLHGVPRMHERPQAALFQALRSLGYRVEAPNDRLPARVHGAGPRAGSCRVSIAQSSQFASALLLPSRRAGWRVEVEGENAEESPYVRMTSEMMRVFPENGGPFTVEPDASSCSYFWAIDFLQSQRWGPASARLRIEPAPVSDWQIDSAFPGFLPPPGEVSRRSDLGDSIMTAIVLAPFFPRRTVFRDLGRLRLQECERVAALRTELEKCGARVVEEGDSLTIEPGELHGAEIETYDDHRMAMCFAVLGTRIPGMRIRHPACVKKTFPNFFQKLQASPSAGLGFKILEARSGAELNSSRLFAT